MQPLLPLESSQHLYMYMCQQEDREPHTFGSVCGYLKEMEVHLPQGSTITPGLVYVSLTMNFHYLHARTMSNWSFNVFCKHSKIFNLKVYCKQKYTKQYRLLLWKNTKKHVHVSSMHYMASMSILLFCSNCWTRF